MSGLLADKAITRKALDEAQQSLRIAEAARREVAAKVVSAEAALAEKAARITKAHADQDSAEARLKVASADRERAQTMCLYTALRAPFDGIVAERNVNTGHFIAVGQATSKPLFVIVRADLLRIFVDVPEVDAATVDMGSAALIRVPSLSGKAFSGQVARTSWVLSTGTRTLRAEVDVPNPDGKLRPGMYAYADLKVAERKDSLSLPKTALVTHEGQPCCLRVDRSGHVVRTPLVTGLRAGNDVEIVAGLAGQEDVIALNVAAYREGQLVEPVSANLPAAK